MSFTIGEGSTIFMRSRFDCTKGLTMGQNSVINDGCHLDTRGYIKIGNNVSVASDVSIITAAHDLRSSDFAGYSASVVLEDYVFVGRRAMILPGCTMGRGAALGAGSVLTKSIPPNEIWAGNPASKIGSRSCSDFEYECQYQRLFH